MAKFDRYMLSQLMVLFGFFAVVLVMVYWVNRAVVLFDRLIADGHSARVFLEFTALSLPNVIKLVLPMAAFGAAVYVTNRLSSESELTVVQANGASPWRLARPVAIFGLVVAGMMMVLTHVLVPASLGQLKQREVEISGDLTASLLREGTFLHPAPGITFYIRDISEEGELRDVFLSDRRNPARGVTYTAERAFLIRDEQGPKLVMVSGMAQAFSRDAARLSTTNFEDFSYDISGLLDPDRSERTRINTVATSELLFNSAHISEVTGTRMGRLMEEAHGRFQQPLLCLVAALVGFATLMAGGFSRFGIGRQIVAAVFLLVLIKLVESAVVDPVRDTPALWPLIYAPSVFGLLLVWGLLWRAAHPFGRWSREAAP